ncbi:MAG: UDP-N-acetylmuramate--L-alanine ligase [Candidatus Pacebacteria bacterium]|nr:UDP-N-acetylmuramate--L-alanine ligase [Candidatus Paceibacterota bacterium]
MIHTIDLQKIHKIFFIGIGGIGMSALARMMHHQGKLVIGSDNALNKVVEGLQDEGFLIHIGQSAEHIPGDIDLVVFSEAVQDYQPEFLATLKKQFSVPMLSYPEMLGVVSRDMFTIAIAGTHGKTTTTGMIATMLVDAGKNPTAVVGSILAREQSNFIAGTSNIFVVEACEYKRSFLNIKPNILVITNIEEDHLDYYKDLADIQGAFRGFTHSVPNDGAIIADTHDPVVQAVLSGATQKVVDYRTFVDQTLGLRVPSEYNLHNAAGALAVARELGIDMDTARTSLENFQGTWRRFEYKGRARRGELIYDDYAHHPTEVRSVLAAAKKIFPDRDIVAIFEPHLFSRTKALFDDFSTCFSDADRVILLPIYFAREEEDASISSNMLGEAIAQHQSKVFVARSYKHVLEYLETTETTDAVIITMGAGSVYHIGEDLVRNSQ